MIFQWTGKGARARLITASSVIALVLSGCTEGGEFGLFKSQPSEAEEVTSADNSVKLIERDVEAPDVFQVTEKGLWDGRPSLGGVWVAHPDVQEPERVIIRNTKNGKFVIGALFRRERNNPGPILQVSSDAADALNMLAGAPAQLNVTALRRESAPDPEALAAAEVEGEGEDGTLAPAEVEQTTLDPLAGAAAAIENAEAAEPVRPATQTAGATAAVATEATPKPTPAAATPARSTSSLSKPYLQIGIFSVEQNARNTATAMRQEGMVPTVKKQSSQGKTFWRVVVGPAQSKSEQSVLLKKVKEVGFDDAYAVTN